MFDRNLDYSQIVWLGFKGRIKIYLESYEIKRYFTLVLYGLLSCSKDDFAHNMVRPKTSTFFGQFAINFILENS